MSLVLRKLVGLTLLTVPALAQPLVEGPPPPVETLEGLWPSPKLLNLMLQRWAEEGCEEYELDAEQRAQVRENVVKQWGEFLTENRATIQPLVNEFMEIRMDLAPPSKERIQAWADRALPLFERSLGQIQKSQDQFRSVLRPTQRIKFEVDALKVSAGLALADQKLRQWKQGQGEDDDFWERLPANRRARREERRRREARDESTAVEKPSDASTDQVVVELDRWEKYVAEFSTRFQLNEGQKSSAESCLRELRERAMSHRDRYRGDITNLERQIATFDGDDAALSELKKRLQDLYGPIDDMFKELTVRLEPIPTADQRASASPSLHPSTPADASISIPTAKP